MVRRAFWLTKIEQAWKHRNIAWLSGVRRAGKTFLSQSLDDISYFDCERPSTRRMLEDPEAFLDDQRGKRIVLDEIHRLPNPSELLKIASDHYPSVKVLATGSSSLGASARFRDTLTGRKRDIWLSPMISIDMEYFGNTSLRHRNGSIIFGRKTSSSCSGLKGAFHFFVLPSFSLSKVEGCSRLPVLRFHAK